MQSFDWKRIRLSRHAQEQRSSAEPARRWKTAFGEARGSRRHAGAKCAATIHAYDRQWQRKPYPIKQVAPVIKEEANEIIVITVYTFYPVMKISYDPEIDALYIRLLEGQQDCRSVLIGRSRAGHRRW